MGKAAKSTPVQKDRPTFTPTGRSMSVEEFEDLITNHYGSVDDVLVTKELADHVLEHRNTGNRKLRGNHARMFVETITKGDFVNTGEPAIFADTGVLNSGQHRFVGVSQTGITVMMDFRFGIPRKRFPLTDTGAKRQASDVLSISGSTSPIASAAAIRLLIAYEAGLPGGYTNVMKLANNVVNQYYERWPRIEEAVDLTKKSLQRKGFVNASTNAFTFLALLDSDFETTQEFLTTVQTGLTNKKYHPAYVLREKMIDDVNLSFNNRAAVTLRLALFIKAWKHWRAGEFPKQIRWTEKEAFPSMDVKLP